MEAGCEAGSGPSSAVAIALVAFVAFACGCHAYDDGLLDAEAPPAMLPMDGSTASPMDAGMDAADPPSGDSGTRDAGDAVVPAEDAMVELDGGAEPPDAGDPDAGDGGVCEGGDCCPNDDAKTDPGVCGCDVPDTDGDGDGTADCNDACPADMAKTTPGVCGCGIPDDDSGPLAGCSGLISALLHRYRFDGNGTAAIDSVSTSDGVLVGNALLDGSSNLVLDGAEDYVDLPNGMISGLSNATFEVWLTWDASSSWQRIFDFGNPSTGGEGAQNTGSTYLFLTPRSSQGFLRVSYSVNGSANEVIVSATSALQTGSQRHIAVVVDDDNDLLLLYRDGVLENSAVLTGKLSAITDVNNWIGRSQYMSDPELAATIAEFRIYQAALTEAQLATSFAAGPDPVFLAQ